MKGIRSPHKTKPYLEKKYFRFKHGASFLNQPKQKELLHNFIKQDEFAIIILDSCRFDYFQEEVDDFLDGELKSVYTSATATMNYIQTIWDKNNYDLTYVTGLSAPTDHAFERKNKKYRPSKHFSDFVHVWQTCENKELGAVPPEKMTETALQQLDDKMVIHYVQPHAPYIGEYQLREQDDTTWGDSLQDIYEKIGRYDVDKKVISNQELKKAYRSNLRRALASVRELVSRLDRPIVVTADHGEMLGEGGRYIHGGNPTNQLCKLPWYNVDKNMIGTSKDEPIETVDRRDVDFTNQIKTGCYDLAVVLIRPSLTYPSD
jgi:gluconate kinase